MMKGFFKGIAVVIVWLYIGLIWGVTMGEAAVVSVGGNSTSVGTIFFVSPKPGDLPTANGTALLNTLNSISDNSADNRYLIKLGPGTYDLGDTGLAMKPYVSIEGSGEKATKITAAVSNGGANVATVTGANNAELHFLTVENTGTGTFTIGILNTSASPSLIHVTVTVAGGTYNHGVRNSSSSPTMTNVTVTATDGTTNTGISNSTSSPTMTNVTVTASGGDSNTGVYNQISSLPAMSNVIATASGGASQNVGVCNNGNSPLIMTNVTATGSGSNGWGVWNLTSGTVKISHSVISGSANSILNGVGVTAYVGNTQLAGGPVNNGGTLTCAGIYDENYIFYPNTCP